MIGTSYGHVLAATTEHVCTQPLTDILKDIQLRENIHLKITSASGELAELVKLIFSNTGQPPRE
jgi:hypothetical protein